MLGFNVTKNFGAKLNVEVHVDMYIHVIYIMCSLLIYRKISPYLHDNNACTLIFLPFWTKREYFANLLLI